MVDTYDSGIKVASKARMKILTSMISCVATLLIIMLNINETRATFSDFRITMLIKLNRK